jgi:hypothetical protein
MEAAPRFRLAYGVFFGLLYVWGISNRWSWWVLFASVGTGLALGLLLDLLSRRSPADSDESRAE